MNKKLFFYTTYLLLLPFSLFSQNVWLDSAISYYEYGDFDKSVALLHKIPNSSTKTLKNRQKAWLGKNFGQLGLYTKAFQILDDNIDKNSLTYIEVLNAKGFLYQNQGYPNEAIKVLEEGTLLLNKFKESQLLNTLKIENFSLTGIAYWQLGAIDEASDYLKQALMLNEQANNKIGAANINLNLGLVYSATDSYKAQYYYEEALKVYNEIYPEENHPSMASIYINIGIVFQKNFMLDKAISSFEKAASIWGKTYGEKHPNIAFAYVNMADAYLKSNQPELAVEFYDLALSQYQSIFGAKHPEIANIFLKKGEINFEAGNTKEALRLYQEALIANNTNFNDTNINGQPSGEDFISPFINIVLLQKKAEALEKLHYTKTLKRSDLIVGVEGLKLAHHTIQNVRTTQRNNADKIRLSAVTNDIYSSGITLCLALSKASINSEKWIKEAFNFVEWSKAATLLASIQETNAKSFSGIPSSLLEKENLLLEEVSALEQQILNCNPSEVQSLEEQLFETQSELKAHVSALEKEYPKYYELKYKQENISYGEIQENIGSNEALISYFIAEKEELLYIFVITKGSIKLFTEVFDDNVKDEIISLETGLKFNFDEIIIMSTNYLSPILFPFTFSDNINKITFLLDGQINNIPMDLLLTEEVTDKNLPFNKYPFLVNKFAVNYNFSATLAFSTTQEEEVTPSFASWAPVNFTDSSGTEILSSLYGTLSEVNEIGALFRTKGWNAQNYTYANARKSILKSDSVNTYNYLHFATHGFVDSEHPNQSFIYLLDEEGHEGLLYAADIYNLDLDVNLVTLSACETGMGKLSKGEGLIGLSRALKYAGAKNSIVSLWNINDYSTALLMKHFYSGITAGESISTSLQKAKIKLIQDGLYFSPYYWAPFTLIGHH
ncbi:CHAT domain-containing protein [Flammeovirga sp. EKP202]|uniref:CHAT domain-containing protein n=1 Tax=Flammeovirga sp. EKP202 TaxID=2770592 RepID=UPI00165EDB2F|nr:CHAT domain-containing protein [Flammeovirga sp. EKP202]MBD0405349.1 CHAT domain-containing protein [Flammeovirga sp. EKP202]